MVDFGKSDMMKISGKLDKANTDNRFNISMVGGNQRNLCYQLNLNDDDDDDDIIIDFLFIETWIDEKYFSAHFQSIKNALNKSVMCKVICIKLLDKKFKLSKLLMFIGQSL